MIVMDKNFKFSIVTAFYNTELYIADCIESVINQTLDFKDNIQLILVDDGSSDESARIALEYMKSYPDNIILISPAAYFNKIILIYLVPVMKV